MSHYLNWKIKGLYDGKILLIEKGIEVKDCIFLDMEIFRKDIRSIGHHMVQFNKNKKPRNWTNFDNCIQPNNLRDYDGYKNFSIKYPLATIHLLLGIVENVIKIEMPISAICPLLYTDGVFKNLFGYPENCIDWLRYLGAENKKSNLHKIFFNEHYSIYDLMIALCDFFIKIGDISEKKKGNDKVKISDSKGKIINLTENDNIYSVEDAEKTKAKSFLKILADLTQWKYKKEDWQWANFIAKKFTKKNIKPNNRNFETMISKKPISWAMTSGLAIEYTLDDKNILLK